VPEIDKARMEVPRLTPEQATDELADIAVWLYLGALVEPNFNFNKDLVKVVLNEREVKLHIKDFELAQNAAHEIAAWGLHQGGITPHFVAASPSHVLEARRFAATWLSDFLQKLYGGKAKLIMLTADDQGCGLWRMRLPASCWKNEDLPFIVSLSDIAITYEELLGYDIIVVQRLTDYNQWKVLNALKKAGKKIVYELDDDIFSVEPTNPAYILCGRDDVRHTVRSCLDIADRVIVTTLELAAALNVTEKAIVYPNSISMDMFSPLRETPPDRPPRLFWAGSSTHTEDFYMVLMPLLQLMRKHEKLEIVVLGGIPKSLTNVLEEEKEQLVRRVSLQPFMRPELYLQALKGGINADVGLIPLRDCKFNQSKSVVKALEYTMAGLPVVASNVAPYNLVYKHDVNILFCANKNEWITNIERLLTSPEDRKRLIIAARELAFQRFELRTNAMRLVEELKKLVTPSQDCPS
jgi:glycosyltransferase involved in cell wall biosynthesis